MTVHLLENEKESTVNNQDAVGDCEIVAVPTPSFEKNTDSTRQSQFVFNNYGGNPTNIVNTGFMSINIKGDSNNDKR